MNIVSVNNTEFSGFDIALRVVSIVMFFAAVILLLYVPPDDLTLVSCAFKDMTGHSCPTCGLTRSLYYLLHFNLVDSLYFHPMGVVLFSGALLVSVKFGYELVFQKRVIVRTTFISTKKILFAIFLFWTVFWIVRLITE